MNLIDKLKVMSNVKVTDEYRNRHVGKTDLKRNL